MDTCWENMFLFQIGSIRSLSVCQKYSDVPGFYSRLVRLEVLSQRSDQRDTHFCFYSRLVRLEDADCFSLECVDRLFLFQIGSIRSR